MVFWVAMQVQLAKKKVYFLKVRDDPKISMANKIGKYTLYKVTMLLALQ